MERTTEEKELLEKNYAVLPERFLKIAGTIKQSLELNDMNIREKALASSSIHHGYLTTYYAELICLKKLKHFYEKKEKEFFDSRGTTPKHMLVDEINKNESFKKIKSLIEEQEIIVQFLKDSLPILAGLTYSVKNSTELIALESR